jgi:hypothetical protein
VTRFVGSLFVVTTSECIYSLCLLVFSFEGFFYLLFQLLVSSFAYGGFDTCISDLSLCLLMEGLTLVFQI